MFGIIVSGRLVQTDVQEINETHFLFNIPEADSVNHIVVFMTGQTPFPEGLGGAVYFSWPNPNSQCWHLLGHISNSKPSAIFKITNLKTDVTDGSSHPFGHQFGLQSSHLAQVGLSVETLTQLEQQTPVTSAAVSTLEPFVEFSQKMLENFVNYAASFAVHQTQMVPDPSATFVPLSTLQNWFQNFQRRLEANPYFWKS